jgi:DNA-binding NtrC family response regulator
MQAEREAIRGALEDTRWNRLQAAKLLKISYRALLYKIKAAGLDGGRPGREAAPVGREAPVRIPSRHAED